MKIFNHQSGRTLSIDSAEIYYEVAGMQGKPVLLVLHGGFGSLEDMDDILDELSAQFYLLGIDSRGHGKSSMGSGTLTYARLQKDVEAVLADLHISRVNIIGFSDGGVVAYRLAAYSSLHIDRIVTIGARWHRKNAETTRHILEAVTAESWKNKFPDTYDLYQRLSPDKDFDRLAKSLVALWTDTTGTGYANEKLAGIHFPLLMIRGDNDPLTSVEALSELQKLVKDSSFFNVPAAGHAPFATQAEMIKIALRKFF